MPDTTVLSAPTEELLDEEFREHEHLQREHEHLRREQLQREHLQRISALADLLNRKLIAARGAEWLDYRLRDTIGYVLEETGKVESLVRWLEKRASR